MRHYETLCSCAITDILSSYNSYVSGILYFPSFISLHPSLF